MIRALAILVLLVLLPRIAVAEGERIVAGLSESRVSITADFTGSEILIYGAIARQAPPPDALGALGVIVTVAGPDQPLVLRRKDRRFGIWINAEAAAMEAAPSFYSVAASHALADVLGPEEDALYGITLNRVLERAAASVANAAAAADMAPDMAAPPPAFLTALMRIRGKEGRFSQRDFGVRLNEDTLFRADVALPAALIEGDYRVRIFLTRGGRVTDQFERNIFVRKDGLERAFTRLALDQPLIYGILSLIFAAVAGWTASAIFARFRW